MALENRASSSSDQRGVFACATPALIASAHTASSQIRIVLVIKPPGGTTILTPTRHFVRINSKCQLSNHFVRQRRIRRVETACAAVAEQAFQLAFLEHAEAARRVHGAVD